eukprot:scaffold3666_cov160-Amphora_coffeaeformis.AAC.11
MMRGKKYATPTKANPQEDEEEHHLYPDQNNNSQDSPNSSGSHETNPNQASPSTPQARQPPNSSPPAFSSWNNSNTNKNTTGEKKSPSISELFEEGRQLFHQKFFAFFEEACTSSPCSNVDSAVDQTVTLEKINEDGVVPNGPVLGISRMVPPGLNDQAKIDLETKNDFPVTKLPRVEGAKPLQAVCESHDDTEEEKEASNLIRTIDLTQTKPPIDPKDNEKTPSNTEMTKKKAPLDLLEVKSSEAVELERSISELTMRSSYGGVEQLQRLPDNRRMAYYAVGKHHRQSGRGGNRRCYFSGKLILGGAPFYAGTVQQGLRTLVVFCLPSAVGLPDKDTITHLKLEQKKLQNPVPSSLSVLKQQSGSTQGGLSYVMRDHSKSSFSARSSGKGSFGKRRTSGFSSIADGNSSIASKSISRLSSLDDLSLSIDGDLDPNWGLDRDLLVQVLPEADDILLKQMSDLFPEQFATLPVQVRASARWNLYVKFCFFSGLPIAEGEMHYKVKDDIADVVYGEELDLSHDVMEAVNGVQSAEILQLPNLKVFRYLRKHYAQQCSKLDDRVFRRTAWERVAPEI